MYDMYSVGWVRWNTSDARAGIKAAMGTHFSVNVSYLLYLVLYPDFVLFSVLSCTFRNSATLYLFRYRKTTFIKHDFDLEMLVTIYVQII